MYPEVSDWMREREWGEGDRAVSGVVPSVSSGRPPIEMGVPA